MRMLIAVGGNALLRKGEVATTENLKHHCDFLAKQLAPFAQEHEILLVHGNGPQVGLLALQSHDAFDILVAESQGMIGYPLQQSLSKILKEGRKAITLLTQVEVKADDPAFHKPSKPIGPYYTHDEKQRLEKEQHWQFIQRDQTFRRLVPSPNPIRIVEIDAIKLMLASGYLVIAAGGGGIPCVNTPTGLQGVEAVIDKDLVAAQIAQAIEADKFFILTDVDGVYKNWGSADQSLIRQASVAELSLRTFESGSMAPKIQAACQFVENNRKPAYIGHLDYFADIVADRCGTKIMVS